MAGGIIQHKRECVAGDMEITYDVYGSMRGDVHAVRWFVLDVSHGWGNRDGVVHGTGADDLRVIDVCMRILCKAAQESLSAESTQPLGKWVVSSWCVDLNEASNFVYKKTKKQKKLFGTQNVPFERLA